MGGGKAVRDPRFAALTADDVAEFRRIVGDDGVVTEAAELEEYNEDWMKKYKGSATVALLPRTTDQVSRVLAHCHARRLAVVPQGGNTGLVGGSIPVFDEVVLSTKRLDKILRIDEASGTCVAEAGVTLEDLDVALEKHGMIAPLDLGPRGKCHVGGNVATNAGGLRLIRYGSLHGSVLGLEVVTADGTVLDLLRTLRKDNTGYDLKQLFIGAEGTLGVITKVAILAPRRPLATNVAVLACQSFADCVAAMQAAKRDMAEVLSAFEFFDRASLDLVLKHLKGTKDPFPDLAGGPPPPFYVVLETSGSDDAADRARLGAFVDRATAQGPGRHPAGVVGRDRAHAHALWELRERISLALKHAGAVYKYDLSMPTAEMYALVEAMRDRFRAAGMGPEQANVMGYGHLGDGNLHLNISCPGGWDERALALIEPFVYEWTAERRGSVSAEHGLGYMKAEEIGHSKDPAAVAVMAGIKRLLDPSGVLNPYKVLPAAATAPRARL